jgi:hypothetical protein
MWISLKRAIFPLGTAVLRLGVMSTGAVNSSALKRPRPSVDCAVSFKIRLEDGLRALRGDLKRKRKRVSGDTTSPLGTWPGVAFVGVSWPAVKPIGFGGAVCAPKAWNPSQRASSRNLAVLAWWCAGCISVPAGLIGVRLSGVREGVAAGCGSCDILEAFAAAAGFCGVFIVGSWVSTTAGSCSWAGDCERDGAVSQLSRESSERAGVGVGAGECCRR